MAKMDWDASNRRTNAGKPFSPAFQRAESLAFIKAYREYSAAQIISGKIPMSRAQWKTAVFDTLREKP